MKEVFTVKKFPKMEGELNFLHMEEPASVGFYARCEEKLDPSTHDHRYDKDGKCVCGKILPDIRPYPSI